MVVKAVKEKRKRRVMNKGSRFKRGNAIKDRAVDLNGYSTNFKLWTDDYSNLFQILK